MFIMRSVLLITVLMGVIVGGTVRSASELSSSNQSFDKEIQKILSERSNKDLAPKDQLVLYTHLFIKSFVEGFGGNLTVLGGYLTMVEGSKEKKDCIAQFIHEPHNCIWIKRTLTAVLFTGIAVKNIQKHSVKNLKNRGGCELAILSGTTLGLFLGWKGAHWLESLGKFIEHELRH